MAIKLMEKNLKNLSGYLMLLYSVTAITFSSLSFIPSALLAESWYVKPSAEIPLRSGKGQEYRILAVIQDGSQVELLEEDGAWARVSTSNGKEGWMPRRYLSNSPPLEDVVATLKASRAQIKKQAISTSKKLDETLRACDQYEQDLKACILDRDQVKKTYNSLKEDAADVIYFKKSLSETAKELQEVKHKYTIAKQENEHLRDNSGIKWFLAGGGILIVGWIIGLITTRGRKRKPSLF
jgi:SH3 domain protein